MHIEVIEPPAALHDHHRELWVKVQADVVTDFYDMWNALSFEQRVEINDRAQTITSGFDGQGRHHRHAKFCTWYPDHPQGEDEEKLGEFIDWWIIPLKDEA